MGKIKAAGQDAQQAATGERTFAGTRKGIAFEVRTTMTDADCLSRLAKLEGTFAEDCAFEIGKLAHAGLRPKGNLVAWGFRLASEQANPPAGITFNAKVLAKFIKARRPLRGERDGVTFEIGFCGPNSKEHGSYRVTNGLHRYSPQQAFFGYITPAGVWKPTRSATPEVVNVISALLNGFGQ